MMRIVVDIYDGEDTQGTKEAVAMLLEPLRSFSGSARIRSSGGQTILFFLAAEQSSGTSAMTGPISLGLRLRLTL